MKSYLVDLLLAINLGLLFYNWRQLVKIRRLQFSLIVSRLCAMGGATIEIINHRRKDDPPL